MFLKPAQDGWGQLKPWAWQDGAYQKTLEHFSQPNPKPALGRAVTGGGKSKFLAQLLASCWLMPNEVIVVTTPTINLVEQLEATIVERLEPPGFNLQSQKIGTFYTHGKDTHTPLIIACMPSLPELAEVLAQQGKKVAMWIADEAHRTATKKLNEAVKILNPTWRLGCSATPFRAKESERLTLFEEQIWNYGPKQALEDNVVVPWRIVPWSGGETTLDEACIEMTKLADGPGLFNAICIDDAELFCIKLEAAGSKARTIHSKLSRGEIKARIEELRSGKLFALVHVAMLQEGVDWPWLRWLCLRRPVGSRVRFAQEIGRTLRALFDPATGKPALASDGKLIKPEAVLYDPHGLFDEFQLSYEAALGGEFIEPEDETEEKASEKEERLLQQLVFDCMKELINVQAGKKPLSVAPLVGYLRELITAFDVCGLIQRTITSRHWRRLPSTAKQQMAITNMLWATQKKQVPKLHQKALGMLTKYTQAMSRGVCSDFFAIQQSLADNKEWPNLKVLDRSATENIEKTEAGKILPNPVPQAPVKRKQMGQAMADLFENLPPVENWKSPKPS